MAVCYKNATVDVALPEGQADSQPSVTRKVHVQPADAKVVYEAFGPDALAKFILLDEPEAAPYYARHGRVTIDGVPYSIDVDPLVWNVVPTAAHVMVALSEIR